VAAYHCSACSPARDWPQTRDYRRCPVCLCATVQCGWADDPDFEECESERKHLAFSRYCRDRDARTVAADKKRADEGGRMIEQALKDVTA
jgi:hypothetical protein